MDYSRHSSSGVLSKSISMMKKPETLKTVQKSLTGFSPIQLSQNEIVFDGIITGERYETILNVTNTSNSARRIRVFQPRNPRFRCVYTMKGALAPGMSIPLSIIFETPDIGEFHESIKIVSEEAVSIEVPLIAFPKQGYVVFEPCIDMGFVSVNKFNENQINFRNNGDKMVRVEPKCKVDGLSFDPIAFQLEPKTEKSVKISYFPRKTGSIKAIVEVNCDGGLPFKEFFDFLANIVEDELLIVDQGGGLTEKLNFGTLYFGEEKTEIINLFNNTPKSVNFEARFLKREDSQGPSLKTPSEFARDQIECVFRSQINESQILQYKTFPLEIKAQAVVSEDIHLTAFHYAIAKSETDSKKTVKKIFSYSLKVEWRNQINEIELTATFQSPQIELSTTALVFGECPVGEYRDLLFTVENKNSIKKIDFEFNRRSGFKFTPSQGFLEGSEKKDIRITFCPKSLGIFKSNLEITFLNGLYVFPINVIASSTSISESVSFDQTQEILVTNENLSLYKASKVSSVTSSLAKHFSKQESLSAHTLALNSNPILSESLPNINDSNELMALKIEDQNPRLPSPKLGLPTEKDDLWVKRAIGKYEPHTSDPLNSIERKPPKKRWPAEPISNKEKIQCSSPLLPSDLERLKAAPNLIEFKGVFVKSNCESTFIIRNGLRNSIQVRISSDAKELAESDFLPQVVPSGESASFFIKFRTDDCGDYNLYVKYLINETHEFFILVKANVTPVDLKIPKNNLKFLFPENSFEMETSEELLLQNKGNSVAKFVWVYDESSVFIPEVKEDFVEQNSEKKVKLIYKPKEGLILKQDEDVLLLRIHDGEDKSIRCFGSLIESKCSVIPEKFNIGTIPICSTYETTLTLKNNLRNFAVYNFVQPLPPGITLPSMVGKLLPEESKLLKLTFQTNEEVELNEKIQILIRGGKTITVPFSVKTTIPKVKVEEEAFDFGEVTVGSESKELVLTLINEGETTAELILDFSPNDNQPLKEVYESLSIQKLREKGEKEEEGESTLLSIKEEENTELSEEKLLEEDESNSSMRQADEIEDRKFKIIVKAKETQRFTMKFVPKFPENYAFPLPLSLQGFGKMEDLEKLITCNGTLPIYQLEPNSIEFPKKIISSLEKRKPLQSKVKIINPTSSAISFRFLTQKFSQENPFEFSQTSGSVQSNSEITISVSFGPMSAGDFKTSVALCINDKVVSHLKIKAISMFPSIAFDRRELILPITPVGIPAKMEFNIINDGYENLTLSHSFAKEFGHYEIRVNYINGRQIGVTKNKLKVELMFVASRTISFTTKLNFFDVVGRTYSIVVSGTAENSVFTLYQFFYRIGDCSSFINNSNRSLEISEEALDDILDFDRALLNNSTYSGRNSISTISGSGTSFLGFSRVSLPLYEQCCEAVKRWINKFLPNIAINSFPKDVLAADGQQMIEIVRILGGLTFEPTVQKGSKVGKVSQLFSKYDQLIYMLKEFGASLNTIRPEYLFTFPMYAAWVKLNPVEFTNGAKFNSSQFAYVSLESWLLLFYQIMKVFHLGKISSLKKLPKSNSNIYSSNEMEVLEFLENAFSKVFERESPQIVSVNRDLKDGIFIYTALSHFIPPLKQGISHLKNPTLSNEDIQFNLERIFAAFYEYGIQNHLSLSEMVYSGPQDLMILLVQLYLSLPLYTPKQPNVVFSCVLGEVISKSIELSNQHDRPLAYWVKFDGSPDFSCEENNVSIPPKSAIKYKVTFKSRISTPVSGNLTFVSKAGDIFQASPLSFTLVSKITGRITVDTYNVKAKLFQQEEVRISLKNDFVGSKVDIADFNITLDFEDKEDAIIPFVSPKDKIKLKKGESITVSVFFTPSRIRDYECKIIFWDNRVGEVQHEIKATCLPPDISGEFRLNNIFANAFSQYEAFVSFKNENFDQAKRLQESKIPVALRSSDRSIAKQNPENTRPDLKKFTVECSPQIAGLTCSSHLVLHEKTGNLLSDKTDLNQSNMDISALTSNKDAKSFDIKSKDSKKGSVLMKKPKKGEGVSLQESVPFIIKPVEKDKEGSSKGRILLTLNFTQAIREVALLLTLRENNGFDIRVFRVIFSVMPKIVRGNIEMRVPIKEEKLQNLPFVNSSERDWTIRTTLNRDFSRNGNFFNGPAELTVKKGTTGYFPLTFAPKKMGLAESKLSIFNQATLESYEFDLIGVGEEPLALDHLVLSGKARETLKKEIWVTNPNKEREMTFTVETDLPYATGESSLTVKGGKEAPYYLSVMPLMGGLFTGSITFKEDDGENYVWYTVAVDAQRPKAEKVISLNSHVRKAVSVEIALSNPLETTQPFDVIIEGEGIYGPQFFTIEPKSTFAYELIFVPLKVMKERGFLSFLNEKLGEICYEFVLTAEDNPPTRIPLISCEVGKSLNYEVEIENPSGQEVTAISSQTNPQNFFWEKNEIKLLPYTLNKVNFVYCPSSLDQVESGELSLESKEIGLWRFILTGRGILPKEFEEQFFETELGKEITRNIEFRNPFTDSLSISVTLSSSQKNKTTIAKRRNSTKNIEIDGFHTLLKTNSNFLPAKGKLVIPILFSPKKVAAYHKFILIESSNDIKWIFPLHGIVNVNVPRMPILLDCQARSSSYEELKLKLPGLQNSAFGEAKKIKVYLKNVGDFISRATTIKVIKDEVVDENDDVEIGINFFPLRPLEGEPDLVLEEVNGGRWIYKLRLVAGFPDVDDEIVITSSLMKSSSVTFKLTNRFKAFAKFKAYFTAESDPEFSVFPKTGDLEPFGREGTTFLVTFTPVEYGKLMEGKLIIETADLYWSYVIKGCFPRYKVPPNLRHSVDDNLEESLLGQLSKSKISERNFLLENMDTKITSPQRKKSKSKKFIP